MFYNPSIVSSIARALNKNVELLARVRDLEDAINTIMVHADYFKNELASYKDVDDTNMERNYIYI